MQQNLISVALLGVLGFCGYQIYMMSKSKRVGESCQFESGPDGYIVYTFDSETPPSVKCRRCNKTGCASYELKKSQTILYGK
jgi:hypothetical protein